MIHWRDETPHRCTQCDSLFSDDDNISWIDNDPFCDWCAEKYLPDAMEEIACNLADYCMLFQNDLSSPGMGKSRQNLE